MAAVEISAHERAAWHGALTLAFAHDGRRTVVATRRHEGPFCIQRPFHPGDGVCHVYLLHPPGGLAAGDRLVLDADVRAGAAALFTTPSATKFYKSDGAPSAQRQTLRAAADASLEWLPESTILFGGSRASIATDVHLHSTARFIGWEMTALGRPLSGDRYAAGALDQRLRICIDGKPHLIERLRLTADAPILREDWGLQGFGVWGAQYAYPATGSLLALARERLCARPGVAPQRAAATLLDELLVVRFLGADAETLRNAFHDLWSTLRPHVLGRAASPPRIWRT